MDGGVITDAQPEIAENGEAIVSMQMDEYGSNIFKSTTGSNIGRSVAIVLDGYAKSWPTVMGEISNGRCIISGNFTLNEVRDLANVLKSGKLHLEFNIVEIEKLN